MELHEGEAKLTRRERVIMDILFAEPGLGVADVQQRLADAASYSGVRASLARLVEKGALRYEKTGARYVYQPDVDRREAGVSALRRVMDTFFHGSTVATMDAVLGFAREQISDAEKQELLALLDERGPDKK